METGETIRRRRKKPDSLRFLLIWSFLGIILPGINFYKAGLKKTGLFILSIWVIGIAVAMNYIIKFGAKAIALKVASESDLLHIGIYAIPALFLILAMNYFLGFLFLPHKRLTKGKKISAWVIAIITSLAIMAPGAVGGFYSYDTYDTLKNVFNKSQSDTANQSKKLVYSDGSDPWADTDRVNLMVLGSDEGKGRTGIRPDVIMVASINTQTGKTQLFNIPRNLRLVKFPEGTPGAKAFPNGFTYEEGLINSVWQWGDQNKDLFPKGSSAGMTATEQAVQGALGLEIDYHVYINMKGFEDLVDAIGGVNMNVPRDLPKAKEGVIPKDWVKAGEDRQLDGNDSLWYVRSRAGSSDYDRMERSRCMVKGIVKEMDSYTLATNYSKLLTVMKDNFSMNIDQSNIDEWAELFERIQKGGIDGVALTNEVITPYNPDYDSLHKLVQDSIGNSDKDQGKSEEKRESDAGVPYAIPDKEKVEEDPRDSAEIDKDDAKKAQKNAGKQDNKDKYC